MSTRLSDCTASSTWSRLLTSTWRKSPAISPAARSADSPSISNTTTCAPASASRPAMARPSPAPAPVTIATRPSCSPMSLCYGIVAALTGRTVVVTGASSGIGRAIAVRCAAEGANVLAVGRNENALAQTAAEDARIATHRAELTDPGAPEAVAVHAVEEFGGLDGLVHAAGTVRRAEDFRGTEDDWLDAFIRVNLTAGMRMAREALRHMIAAGSGSIVLVGSQLAHVAQPGYASYVATKGGITSFARALAVDAGPQGVRVNVLAPGVVTTPAAYVDRPDLDELAPQVAARLPLRRVGEPEDMAGPAVFLLSDQSAWMTGQTLIVDGGFTIQ